MEEVLIDLLEKKLDLEYLDIETSVLSDKYLLLNEYLDENKFPTTDK